MNSEVEDYILLFRYALGQGMVSIIPRIPLSIGADDE
jgi:hypothetical protein